MRNYINYIGDDPTVTASPYVPPEEEPDDPPVGEPVPPEDTPIDPETEEPEPGIDPNFVEPTRVEVSGNKQTVIRTESEPNTWGNAYIATPADGYDFWEIQIGNSTPKNATLAVGISNLTLPLNGIPGDLPGTLAYWSNGSIRINGVDTNGFPTFAKGNKISIARDKDTGRIWFAKNGVWFGSTPIVGGSGHQGTLLGSGPYYPFVGLYSAGSQVHFNFITSKFSYPAPTGFYPLGKTPASGGTPEWVPEGAVAHLDFINGNYYDGQERTAASILGGAFDAGAIGASGMAVWHSNSNRPNIIGSLADVIEAGLASGMTVVADVTIAGEPTSGASHSVLLAFSDTTDFNSSNFQLRLYVGVGTKWLEVSDWDSVSFLKTYTTMNLSGLNRIGYTVSRNLGGGTWRYAHSANGEAAMTDDVTYSAETKYDPEVVKITLGHIDDYTTAFTGSYIRSLTIYPPVDETALAALTSMA